MPPRRRRTKQRERIRDAERSQAALLDAAQVEFAAKGYAGARVDAIASRAGVNKQLISYYFGGKRGIYDAIGQRLEARASDFDRPGTTLAELVARYFTAFQQESDLQRIFLREVIDQDPTTVVYEPDASDVVGLRARQAGGEIADELDPAFVLLFLQSMGVVGGVFASDVKRLTGLDPHSSEFRDRAVDQLTRIVRRLA